MKEIERQFALAFAHWKIVLPPHDVANRRRGKIVKSGWAIWYLFGSGTKGEYLDYYASHRMTSDEHVRLRETGEREYLPTLSEMHLCSDDPAENKRLEADFYAENQRIARLLEAKGLVWPEMNRAGCR